MMRTAKFDCFALGRKLISPLQDITNSTKKKTSFTELMISREKFEIYDHKNVNKKIVLKILMLICYYKQKIYGPKPLKFSNPKSESRKFSTQ